MSKCKSCYGYGFWCWGDIEPMGSIDAMDGVPTIKCPECGANPNPVNQTKLIEERQKKLNDMYNKGLLKIKNLGERKNEDDN